MDFKFSEIEQFLRQSALDLSSMHYQNHHHHSHQQERGQYHNHHQQHPLSMVPFHQFTDIPTLIQQHPTSRHPSTHSSPVKSSNYGEMPRFDSGFSVILVAPTLGGIKLSEDPITCLNQGQSYDIKLRKQQNDLFALYYKSNIRLMFHDRRQQHMEQQQFQTWLHARPDQRLFDLDLPLAYNVLSSAEDPRTPNMISISWMGQSEASISVKINCISTEFTAKKHGGEKGVPFRLQVDTYAVMDDEELNIHLLHRAFCVIKVFKPNGADRKNKMNASKLMSKSSEQYHPIYNVTQLMEVSSEHCSLYSPVKWFSTDNSNNNNKQDSSQNFTRSISSFSSHSNLFVSSDEDMAIQSNNDSINNSDVEDKLSTATTANAFEQSATTTKTSSTTENKSHGNTESHSTEEMALSTRDIAKRIQDVLLGQTNKKHDEDGSLLLKITNENLLDLLRLTTSFDTIKEDHQPLKTLYISFKKNKMTPVNEAIQLSMNRCPVPLISLQNNSSSAMENNTFTSRRRSKRSQAEMSTTREGEENEKPFKKRILMEDDADSQQAPYRGIYLHHVTRDHLIEQMCSTFDLNPENVANIFTVPSQGVHVLITDEEVKYMKNYSPFHLSTASDTTGKMIMFLA